MLVALLFVIIIIMIVSLVAFTIYHFITKGPAKIGLNYKKGVSQEFDSIATNIQVIVNKMENATCKEMKSLLASEMYQTMLTSASSTSCAEMRAELQHIETADPAIKDLMSTIFSSVCTGDKMDKAKLDKLVKGTYDSMCSQEW